jgi:hypothetical protein
MIETNRYRYKIKDIAKALSMKEPRFRYLLEIGLGKKKSLVRSCSMTARYKGHNFSEKSQTVTRNKDWSTNAWSATISSTSSRLWCCSD